MFTCKERNSHTFTKKKYAYDARTQLLSLLTRFRYSHLTTWILYSVPFRWYLRKCNINFFLTKHARAIYVIVIKISREKCKNVKYRTYTVKIGWINYLLFHGHESVKLKNGNQRSLCGWMHYRHLGHYDGKIKYF